ncbi:early endosome antigen 1 isoform X3 [Drosophila hydei]|uniref:Early endosome antigen 1 isoform X3 n=1 Tax=Drosophila hydei TaxID=7224 RepID=A0A6J1LAL5_DROHY|nr:early endosome antigen 1 isoform X3 [Drosophila hydei]
MELRVWKAILLQWVRKCNFIADVTCLEDSDIEEFFTHYAQFSQVELTAEQPALSPLSLTFSSGQLLTFLRDIYPNFKPLLESNGRIMTTDYIYVYTLLMHYTCVQSPNEYFHNICRNLPDITQQCIADFFQQTIKNPELTRNCLRETIASISDIAESNVADLTPIQTKSRGCTSFSSERNGCEVKSSELESNNKDSATIDNDATASTNFATPIPVQRELTSLLEVSQNQAPSTPKTVLLEQRTRELLGLRAQLETERYEKAVLEDQILENEQLINSLSKENKVKKKQLAKLTASLEYENDECNYMQNSMPNEFENLKRQLLKEINNKDAMLAESKEEMQELKNKYDKLADKLKLSEKQMLVCMDKINDLELRLENATLLLTEKDDDIACLQRDKLELQQCLQEARAELHNGREVLNASSDLLETSQSTASMNTTPETLACSVIDKQLREKELENVELRDQLEAIWKEKKSILENLLTIVQHYQLEMPPAPDDSQILDLVGRSMDQLNVRFEKEQLRVKELQAQYDTLHQRNIQNEEIIQRQQESRAKKLDQALEQSQLILLEGIKKCRVRDNEIRYLAKISADIEKKDEELEQLGCEIIQLSSRNHILEERVSTEEKCALSRGQELKAQQIRLHSQEKLIDKQQQQINENQQQLQCFIDTIGSRFDLHSSSAGISDKSLKQVEKMLISWQDQMQIKLKHSESEILNQSRYLTAVDRIVIDILSALNAHTKSSIENNNISNDPLLKKLVFVQNQLSQFVTEYDQLTKKCKALNQSLIQSVEVKRQEHDALQKEHKETILKLTDKLNQLQSQCDKVMKELQQKNAECEEMSEKLQVEKELRNKVDSNDVTRVNGDLGNVNGKDSAEQMLHEEELKTELIDANMNQSQLVREPETTTEEATVQNGNQIEVQCQLEQAKIKEELNESNEKQKQLEQELKEKAELVQKSESTIQALQEEIVVQTQQSDMSKAELKNTQQKLEEAQQQLETALQQLQKEESLVVQVNELEDLIKVEQSKNLSLEQAQIHQMEQKRVIEKQLTDMQYLFAKREDELEKSKAQLDSSTKRLEKIAIKLGEQQAILSKTQREMAQAKLKQSEQAELIAVLQHEKDGLQLELRKNKERANRSEEKQASLEQQRIAAEADRDATHEQLMKLERDSKKANSSIRDLQQQMKNIENEKVSLVLEVGGLNSEIVQQQKRIADLSGQLQQANGTMSSLILANENNAATAEQVVKERSNVLQLQSQLAEARQELEGMKHMHESMQCELGDKMKELELERSKSKDRESHYQRKLNNLNDELKKCNEEIADARNNHEKLLDTLEKESRTSTELLEAQQQLQQQRAQLHQRELDCQILQAKYRETKEEMARCEQKLKDQRLEMEGKLEKMKSKMRTLYTAEVTRIKEKQERDAASNKVELEKLNGQITKYEEHTRKLANQIVRLNEKLLEQQKKYAILSTKLRHLQEAEQPSTALATGEDWQPFKRPCAPSANLGSNLAMEDEEGEVFNNTYLTDLKLGTVPNMTAEELQYRNSLQPPHLKSAYAAQYDLGTQEDDIKDGPHSLDDSMSALLSTTDNNGLGTRKKSMGTHYKRPGPPTPSKNGGRLSFGGSEPPREILRETCDNNGTAKTPARFKIFTSRFSIGSSGIGGGGHCLPRDENSPPKRRLSNMFKRK